MTGQYLQKSTIFQYMFTKVFLLIQLITFPRQLRRRSCVEFSIVAEGTVSSWSHVVLLRDWG